MVVSKGGEVETPASGVVILIGCTSIEIVLGRTSGANGYMLRLINDRLALGVSLLLVMLCSSRFCARLCACPFLHFLVTDSPQPRVVRCPRALAGSNLIGIAFTEKEPPALSGEKGSERGTAESPSKPNVFAPL